MATSSDFPQEPNPFIVQWVIAIYQEFCRTEQHFRAIVEMRNRDISHLKEEIIRVERQLKDDAAQVEIQQHLVDAHNQRISTLKNELASYGD